MEKYFHFVPSGHEFLIQLVVQWARSSTRWVGSCFHIFRISEGSKSTLTRKNFDTTGVEVVGATGVPGYFATIGREVGANCGPVGHNYPYTLYTARFWSKNETPDMKFYEKSFSTYLPQH